MAAIGSPTPTGAAAVLAPIIGLPYFLAVVWLMGRGWMADVPAGIILFGGLIALPMTLYLLGHAIGVAHARRTARGCEQAGSSGPGLAAN